MVKHRAKLLLLTYYNPFAVLGAENPLYRYSQATGGAHEAIVSGLRETVQGPRGEPGSQLRRE